MKKRNAVIDVNPTTIAVSVKVQDDKISVEPNIPIRWDFNGIVQWTIDGPDDATFDPTEGVKFADENAPFHPYRVSSKVWAMDASNTNLSTVSIPYKYTLKLADGKQPIVDDPTVENDSPPEPPRHRTRRIRRIARTRV